MDKSPPPQSSYKRPWTPADSDSSPEVKKAKMLDRKDLAEIQKIVIEAVVKTISESNLATKKDVGDLQASIKANKEAASRDICELKARSISLSFQLEELDRKSRIDKLSIAGLQISSSSASEVTKDVQDLLSLLADKDVKVKSAYVLDIVVRGKPLIIAKLENDSLIPSILMSNKRKNFPGLKISRDMSAAARLKSNRMLKLRHEIGKARPEIKRKLKLQNDTVLRIDDKRFEWFEDQLLCNRGPAEDALSAVAGRDFMDTINEIIEFRPPRAAAGS